MPGYRTASSIRDVWARGVTNASEREKNEGRLGSVGIGGHKRSGSRDQGSSKNGPE
jgi:hypothetical protein